MSQQTRESNEKADSRSQVSSVINADTVDGEMVGVLMDQLTDGTEVSNVQEVGAVGGRLVGVQIGTSTGGSVACDQEIGAVSGVMIGAQIGTLGDAPAPRQPTPSEPPVEPVGLAGRIRAWLTRVFG